MSINTSWPQDCLILIHKLNFINRDTSSLEITFSERSVNQLHLMNKIINWSQTEIVIQFQVQLNRFDLVFNQLYFTWCKTIILSESCRYWSWWVTKMTALSFSAVLMQLNVEIQNYRYVIYIINTILTSLSNILYKSYLNGIIK